MNKIKSNLGSATQVVIIAMGIVFTIIFTIFMYISTQIKTSMSAKDYIERTYLAQAGIESSIAYVSEEIIGALENIENKKDTIEMAYERSYINDIKKNLNDALSTLKEINQEDNELLSSIISEISEIEYIIGNKNHDEINRRIKNIINKCLMLVRDNNFNIKEEVLESIKHLNLAIDNIVIYGMTKHSHEIVEVKDNLITDKVKYEDLIHKELIVGNSNFTLTSIFYGGDPNINLQLLINESIKDLGGKPEANQISSNYSMLFQQIGFLKQQSEFIVGGHVSDITGLLNIIENSIRYLDLIISDLYNLNLNYNKDIEKVLNGVYVAKNTLNEIKCKLGIYGTSSGDQDEKKEYNIKILYNKVEFINDKIKVDKYKEIEKNITISLDTGKIEGLRDSDDETNGIEGTIIRAKGIEGGKTYEVEAIVDFIGVDLSKKEVNYKIKSYKKLNKTGG